MNVETMKIIAVVVTYNRFSLLQRTVDCLRQQSRRTDGIVVVDNGCTDGTAAWLDGQTDLHVIHQGNEGGSGGFFTGMKQAFDMGADWIWCMDDDVFPHADCLEHLLRHADDDTRCGIMAPRRLLGGQVYTNDFCRYNLSNPFASMYQDRLKRRAAVCEPIDIVGTAFEGMFVKRAVVGSIGLPERGLFIFCDDTDYCLRAVQSGFTIRYIPDALMDKEQFFRDDSWTERNRKKKWKRFYQVRNSTYLNHKYGRNVAVRYLRGFICVAGYILTALAAAPLGKAYSFADIPMFWRAYRDGLNHRLGIFTATRF